MASWLVALTNLAGATRALLEPDELVLSRKLNGAAELAFKIRNDSTAAELAIGSSVVKAYRDGALVFHGRVHEPLVTTRQHVAVIARDPIADLAMRYVQSTLTYAATDAGAIASALLAHAAADHETRLAAGTIASSVSRDRTYEEGKAILEALVQLGEVDGGFYFRCDPLDVAGTFGELVILYPGAGDDLPGLRFECGAGTLDNLSDFQEELRLPRNRVRAIGAEVAGVRVDAEQESASSIAALDLYETQISFATVEQAGTLSEHALGALQVDAPAAYSVTPTPDAPLLVADFNVGDSGRLRIDAGRVNVTATVRISEATLRVSEGGVETLAAATLGDASIRRLPRTPARRLLDLLEATDRRLASLERA